MQSQKTTEWHFQSKPFNITVIQVYAPISNADEAEFEQLYEDLQDHLITSWQIGGETMADCYFLGPKSPADSDCSHEIKRHLLLRRKAMTNQNSILKSRVITFINKCLSSQHCGFFLVVMYGYESWTIKKAKCWRIDAFQLWYWRRLLRVCWTARRSNQSILKEINPEYLL